jgi:DNA polymerase-1
MKKNASPTIKNINCCRKNLQAEIEELKPEKIITLGKVALKSLIGHKCSVKGIGDWVGFAIPDQEYGSWIFPVYNPKQLIANQKDIPLFVHFNKYLEKAILHDEEFIKDKPDINFNPTFEDISCFVHYLLEEADKEKKQLVVDIETTGLNPREEVPHEIICVSLAANIQGKNYCICFDANKENIFPILFDHPNIQLIAHNIKFENLWIWLKLGLKITNWYADTMLLSHIVDNRPYISSLKFQTYLYFGIKEYEKEAHKYMKTNPETGLNSLKEMDQSELRKYCALDSWYTLNLFQRQMYKFKFKKAFKFFMEGLLCLIEMQNNGINTNKKYFEKTDKELADKLNDALNNIMTSKEAIAWKNSEDKPLNINSSPQLKKLFYKILDYKVIKTTPKGNPSVDAEVLGKINNKFCKSILAYRKISKIKDTYLSNYIDHIQPDGYLHPAFNLHIPRTYRSSSSDPNLQNVPKHDKEAKKLLRSGIGPKPRRFLFEPDYGQLEVRIGCPYHQDPVLIQYVKDGFDFHKAYAKKIFFLKEKDMEFMAKYELRFITKNKFVFAEFYGDYYVRCAINIWEELDKEVKQHLKKHGISGYRDFEDHLKKIESIMWNKDFKVYSKWKKDIWNFYLQNGYIRTYTGFTFTGVMKRNDVTNYPVQGTAFHCLLYSAINIQKELKKRKMKTELISEIHDALVFDVVPEEFDKLKKICRYVMCEKIREDWKWINVPLDIDGEMSAIDGTWSEMTKVKDL